MPDGPLTAYRHRVAEGALRADDAQRAAVEKLQLLHMRLKDYAPRSARGIWGLFGFTRRGEEQVAERIGLYMYGGVGRGKSMLMDLFFETAPIEPKKRVHFHAFMQDVHKRLNAARASGVEDPIPLVAGQIADEAALLCFDEMQVTDIADAMILGRLFEAFFERHVVIVTTSNRHPNDLYKNGLQRERFVPFIEMICQRLDLHHLDGPTDFRLARLRGLQVYYSPLDETARGAMDAAWEDVTGGGRAAALDIEVQGRTVTLPRFCNGVGRASFAELCARPLGPADYLAIAGAVKALFIDEIPRLSRANNNEAKRFVTLIDALYEGRKQLVCSAAAAPEHLYEAGEGAFEFERTVSRLMEMQSKDYLAGSISAA
ncbi:MAG: cell division protein ZapE [Neomegalonema sp.]|nr:cell division protein ZapE [Neomegalonema sp.]